jgi:hypothetical protein
VEKPSKELKRLSTQEALESPHDRRHALRTPRKEDLFVQLSATHSGAPDRRTLKCESADLSHGGLRLAVNEALPAGALLELWIKLRGARRNYYLVGDVRWCVEGAHGFDVGVGVKDAPATDYKTWRRLCLV